MSGERGEVEYGLDRGKGRTRRSGKGGGLGPLLSREPEKGG